MEETMGLVREIEFTHSPKIFNLKVCESKRVIFFMQNFNRFDKVGELIFFSKSNLIFF